LLFVFLMIAILMGMRWNLYVTLICISFVAKNVKYFFMCVLAICISFSKNCLLNSFTH
jgi:hypothetical protein